MIDAAPPASAFVAVERAFAKKQPSVVRLLRSDDGREWLCRFYDNRPKADSLDFTRYVMVCVLRKRGTKS